MEEKKQKPLSIGLFEENLEWLVLLQALLAIAGHAVSLYREERDKLGAWLAACSKPQGFPGLLPYDLLIIDIADGTLLSDDKVYACFERIICQGTPHLILLTSEILQELHVPRLATVLPFRDPNKMVSLFQMIERLTGVPSPLSLDFLKRALHKLREQGFEALAVEQAWLDQRRSWLAQRCEWQNQRQSWLAQRREWLENARGKPNCQREWLEEQNVWLEQQEKEVSREQVRISDLERWLIRSQKDLDQMWRQHFQIA